MSEGEKVRKRKDLTRMHLGKFCPQPYRGSTLECELRCAGIPPCSQGEKFRGCSPSDLWIGVDPVSPGQGFRKGCVCIQQGMRVSASKGDSSGAYTKVAPLR